MLALCSCGGGATIDAEAARAEIESRDLSVDLAGLQRAAVEQEPELIELFFVAGVDPNSFEKASDAPLMAAARTLNVASIKRLLEGGATTDRLPELPFVAASRGHVPALAALLDGGADIEALDPQQRTPLLVAVDEGRTEIVRLLLKRGASTEGAPRGDRRQTRPLIQAARFGFDEIAQLLIEAGANIESSGGQPRSTPLIAAARSGQLPTVKLLLDAGADPKATLAGGVTAADVAERAGHTEIAALLR